MDDRAAAARKGHQHIAQHRRGQTRIYQRQQRIALPGGFTQRLHGYFSQPRQAWRRPLASE